MTYSGSCFCGAVSVEATGEPDNMGYCHCGSCRSWSAGPINAFTLWAPENVRVTEGQEHVATFQKSAFSLRDYCGKCGGHVMSRHPTLGVVDIFAATLPALAFQANLHVHYGETVLPIRDGLPKFKDFPEAFGGTGELIAE